MAEYSVKCPKCGNWVVGKIKRSTISKGIRGAVKSGGMKGLLTAGGSVIPGFGNLAGFVTGAVIDAIYGDEIKEMVDGAADKIMEDSTYSFDCPGCGHHWKMEEKKILKMIANGNKGSVKNQSMQSQAPKKKPIDSVSPTSTLITRKEAFKIISFVMHIPLEYIDGTTSVNLGRSALKSLRKKGYNIPERVIYQCRSYNDLADAIIASKANQYATEPSSSKTISSDVKQEQMFTKQMSEKTEIGYKKEESNKVQMANESQIPEGCSLKGYSSNGNVCYGHDEYDGKPFRMTIDDVFLLNLNGGKCVLTGCIEEGSIRTNDEIYINGKNDVRTTTVLGIEMFRQIWPYAEKGDNVGILISTELEGWLSKGMIVSSQELVSSCSSEYSDNEREYLNSVKELLEDNSTISDRERKMLNRIRQSLGISDERAAELEVSLTPQLTEDEQEYVEMYREYAEKGEITEKERRRLDKFAAALGISEERMKEIETR